MTFDQLLEVLHLEAKESPWNQAQTVDRWLEYVLNEAHEAVAARSKTELAGELGDVLANVIKTLIELERYTKGRLSLDTVMEGIVQKSRERRPWLFDSSLPRPQTPAEDHRMYMDAKRKARITDG